MKYTTLQIIRMMFDWRSWRVSECQRFLCNDAICMLRGYGLTAWNCCAGVFWAKPFNRSVAWDVGFYSYIITRPFWWYLNHKVKP